MEPERMPRGGEPGAYDRRVYEPPAYEAPAHQAPVHEPPVYAPPVYEPRPVTAPDLAAREPRPGFARALDRALAVQRPAVLAHIRSVRLRHPEATPAQVIRILERRYLLAITGGGAAVGATAVIPAVSTPATLALSGVETVGFLESTALFAQSVAEVHGIPVENPDRARVLVMSLMLGQEAGELLAQFTQQAAGRGVARSAFWGETVTKSLPRGAVRPVLDKLQRSFMRHFAKIGGGSIIGKALPFGIGAAVGGAGNHLLGRKVVTASRRAFGPAPQGFSPELAPKAGAERIERKVMRGARAAGGSIAAGAGAVGRGAKRTAGSVRQRISRRDSAETGEAETAAAAVDAGVDRTGSARDEPGTPERH